MAACLDSFYEIVRPLSAPHHPHQTPSLCRFRVNSVFQQIQVDQSRVLFQAFGQGLTGEIRWTLSPALELIKLWVSLSPLSPPFLKISPAEGWMMKHKKHQTSNMPFFLTILAKHQAFAPSTAILFNAKLKFVKVEFALRPSAKAFESSSWIDQTLGPLSPPLFSRFFCQAIEPRDEGWDTKYGFECHAICFFLTSTLLKFAQKQPWRDIWQNNQKQPVKNHGASIDLQHWDQQRSTLQCIPFRDCEHFTDFTFNWLCLDPSSMPLFLPTILTKRQAFAPSAPIWFKCKSRFFRVEFSLRPSAKAFESISWIDQTLGPLSPPLFSSFFVELLKWGMRDDT